MLRHNPPSISDMAHEQDTRFLVLSCNETQKLAYPFEVTCVRIPSLQLPRKYYWLNSGIPAAKHNTTEKRSGNLAIDFEEGITFFECAESALKFPSPLY